VEAVPKLGEAGEEPEFINVDDFDSESIPNPSGSDFVTAS
jgi:hypothetical protein